MWKVFYSLTSSSSIQDVRFRGNLNTIEMTSIIAKVHTNTTTHYANADVKNNVIFYRISETFNMYVTTRVAYSDFRKFQVALVDIWSLEISGKNLFLVLV